jgi:cyclophilin family peptidyl-prolyl cis-trans isomerase
MKRILLALTCAFALTFGSRADAANPVVVMKTSAGTIKIELFADKAPGTVKNFLKYVDDKHYDNTVFHRVIEDFMIQGGGYEKGFNKSRTVQDVKGKEKRTGEGIKNESTNGLENKKYTVAMARTGQPDSATAQFFINTKDNAFLDRARARDRVGYCVFGKVIDGSDVVDKIKGVKTMELIERVMENVPVEEVVIESVRVEKK